MLWKAGSDKQFLVDLHTYSHAVWPTTTKFSMLTHRQGQDVFIYKGSAMPITNGVGHSVPQIFGTSYTRTHGVRNSNQILRHERKILKGRPLPMPWPKFLRQCWLHADVANVLAVFDLPTQCDRQTDRLTERIWCRFAVVIVKYLGSHSGSLTMQ